MNKSEQKNDFLQLFYRRCLPNMITPLQSHAAELAEIYNVPLDEEKKQGTGTGTGEKAQKEEKDAKEAVDEKTLSAGRSSDSQVAVELSSSLTQTESRAALRAPDDQCETRAATRVPEKAEVDVASASSVGAKSEREPETAAVVGGGVSKSEAQQASRSGAGDSYRHALQLSHVLEVLTFCAEHHAHTSSFKNFLVGRNFLPKCLPPLFHSRHTFLLLGTRASRRLTYEYEYVYE